MEPVVGAGLSSERGTLRDNPLASSFIAGVAPSKADVRPSRRKRSESRLAVLTGFSCNGPCECAVP